MKCLKSSSILDLHELFYAGTATFDEVSTPRQENCGEPASRWGWGWGGGLGFVMSSTGRTEGHRSRATFISPVKEETLMTLPASPKVYSFFEECFEDNNLLKSC